MKTVIMAGGRGTRISAITSDIPKPLIKIEGKSVLEHEIACLRECGFTEIILTVSHLANQIIGHFGSGKKFGVNIDYFVEERPLGNAGALFKLGLENDFLLLNADVLFNVDFSRLVNYHRAKGGLATLFTHPNSHPYDSGIIVADTDAAVVDWLTKESPKPRWYANRVNAGLHVINPAVLAMTGIAPEIIGTEIDGKVVKVDLDRQVLRPLCNTGKMFCYDSPEYVRDMGTPDRYQAVCRDFASGCVQAKSLRNRQRAIFLDRDGTINKYVGFLQNVDQFELLTGVTEAIKKINASGYLAILVTNQPVIARGELTVSGLREIHNKMETLLGAGGAYLDAIYYCPHHPHKGYAGEVMDLKIDCECRKPKPGMLLRAAEKFNIDLSASWMIGDSESDIKAGKAAECRTALIGTEDFGQDKTVGSLLEFVDFLFHSRR